MAKAHNPHHTEAHIITSIFQAVRWGGLDGKRISFGAKYFSFFRLLWGCELSLVSQSNSLSVSLSRIVFFFEEKAAISPTETYSPLSFTRRATLSFLPLSRHFLLLLLF